MPQEEEEEEEIKYFSGAECDIDHCLVVAEVRETVSIHKQSALKFVLV